ncbi:hypothetical protein NUW58_g5023 [Xylaria curta]|uniref:Uncharacterized protein n=1 Tax=Xylaria curta TaxID=42375 RepID=A0ACC1P5X2_9PEZI|nr:hypothetical protein NUW58_g5023 [Xylaria curta]
MKPSRYSTSRQKACQQCSISKAKCDRVESGCSRCIQRALPCAYPRTASHREGHQPPVTDQQVWAATQSTHSSVGRDVVALLELGLGSHHSIGLSNATVPEIGGSGIRDFEDLRLTCPINADGIGNRWLGAYIPLPDQKVKEYPATVKSFLHRMVKSYVTVTVRGRGYPPFIHASQIAPHIVRPPLSTCLSLVRICEHQLPGSEGVAVDVLQREMSKLHEQHETYDTFTLLCAFQAYLIFTMVLFFRLGQIANPFLRQAVMNLQELACASAKRGLVCDAEQQWLRPRWESWIVAEASRRTLYTMYLFDGILSAHDGLPTFVGTELKGLLAPASQALWRAQTRLTWEASYNSHLADWSEGGFRIDELWPIPEDFDDADVLKRQNRVDLWLEGVDEFGTMLYAVTSSTHG